MMISKRFTRSLTLLFCFIWLLFPVGVFAADVKTPSYSLEVAGDRHRTGDELSIKIKGTNFTNLYANELHLNFDSERLKFAGAKSELPGFSVEPIIKGDEITIAHTRTGSYSGDNGDVLLYTLKFKAISEGNAVVVLNQAKIVNSKLDMTTQTTDVKAAITIGRGESAADLTDIAGHWAESSIRQAVSLGFVNGYTDGKFRPQGEVTRAEFAKMLIYALQLQDEEAPELSFADHSHIPAWSVKPISIAAQYGFMRGFEDNTFQANNPITRVEITAVIVNVLKLQTDRDAISSFTDDAEIPLWAKPSVVAAAEAGIIKGKANQRFAPKDFTTRAEAVTLILALLGAKS